MWQPKVGAAARTKDVGGGEGGVAIEPSGEANEGEECREEDADEQAEEAAHDKSKVVIDSGAIIVAKKFPESHIKVINLMKKLGVNENNMIKGNLFEEMKSVFTDKKELNNGIKFAKY